MLKQDAMTPLYVQLMDTVEKDIKSGRYKSGDKIMTESEMAKTYGVSLITVRKAIGSLMEKGLVVRKQGKGTFVTKPKFSRNIKRLQSFSEMCEQMGVVPGAHMLENKIVDADEKIAARLGIETGSKVIFISRLRFADSEPVVIEKNYFPLKYAFLLEAQFEDNSLFDYLKEKAEMQVMEEENHYLPFFIGGGCVLLLLAGGTIYYLLKRRKMETVPSDLDGLEEGNEIEDIPEFEEKGEEHETI